MKPTKRQAAMLDRLRRARRHRDRMVAAARRQMRASAIGLRKLGLSLRDCGFILGISHQRVHQIVNGPANG